LGAAEEAKIAYAWSARSFRTVAAAAREQTIAAYAWTAPRARTLGTSASRKTAAALSVTRVKSKAAAAATLETISAALFWGAEKSVVLGRAGTVQVWRALAWLAAASMVLSRASLAAGSRGAAWAGARGRELAVIAAKTARRGAEGLRRASLAVQSRLSDAIARRRIAAAQPGPEPQDVRPIEPQAGTYEVEPPEGRVPLAAAASLRRTRAASRAVRAKRPALRGKLRVAGQRPARRAVKRSSAR